MYERDLHVIGNYIITPGVRTRTRSRANLKENHQKGIKAHKNIKSPKKGQILTNERWTIKWTVNKG